MPTTYKPRKQKVKQSVRQSVKQSVVIHLTAPARRKTTRPRSVTAGLTKALLTRPTPPAVITIPQGQPALSFEAMRTIADQEKQIQGLLEKQAVLSSKLSNIKFATNQEGVLVPEVPVEQREVLAKQLEETSQASQAAMTALEDAKRGEGILAFRPPKPTPSPALSINEQLRQELQAVSGKRPSEIREERSVAREPSPSPEPVGAGAPTEEVKPPAKGTPSRQGRPAWGEGVFPMSAMLKLKSNTEGGVAMEYPTLVKYANLLKMETIPKGAASRTPQGKALRLAYQREMVAILKRDGYFEGEE